MKISYTWLKEYIGIPESPEEIGKVLTSTGLEVENIEVVETVKGGLQGLVLGQVLTCAKHPNADKLSLTTVDVGAEKPLHIVCGASNVKAGQKVVVALVGTTVHPLKGEPFTIKTAKIRGEQSEGMICAEDEIGLGESHEGIMVLNTDAPNGTQASAYFNVHSDYVLEIGLTPNRADAACHVGVARDIRAAKNRPLKLPPVDLFVVDNKSLTIPVTVENKEACIRYSAVTVKGVTIAESPGWLQNRLKAIGLTPINNVVDITNFVLHELGQPLHAFDADKIAGGKVIVKTLPPGSKFITLDGKERTLLPYDLMICSETEGMSIAGVFGGYKSGITSSTKNIFLESACFSPEYIRRTSMQHQLKTDASFRYERGTDPNITVYALKRAALLIKEIAGGSISSEITDLYPEKIVDRQILVKDKNVNRLIGKEIPREEIFDILERLDIKVINKSTDAFTVTVPPYRVDTIQEADIVEEILRIYGFNNIELSDRTRTDFFADFPVKDKEKYRRTISEMLVANGFYEIWTNSLTNKAYYQQHSVPLKGEPVEIINKLSEEQGILRLSMLFTGLEVCVYNINRKQKDLKLFEIGKIYWKTPGGNKVPSNGGDKTYHEEERLALYMTGNAEIENWQHKTQPVSYYDLTQHVYEIIRKSGLKNIKQNTFAEEPFEYGLSISDENSNEIGKAGKIRSSVLKSFGIKQDLFYAELNSSLLFKAANPKLVIQEVSKFPEVRRDLSLVLDRQVSFDEIRYLIRSVEKRLIKDVIVFDVYEGKNIPENKKAYAMGFTLQDESKTLTDEEIDKTMNRLISAFEQKLGAVIRK